MDDLEVINQEAIDLNREWHVANFISSRSGRLFRNDHPVRNCLRGKTQRLSNNSLISKKRMKNWDGGPGGRAVPFLLAGFG
ncbi:MAG: hypothetical protein H7833_15770, partial [Magnetococcus sp. DMHC-1]